MKEAELRQHTTCSLCSKPIGQTRLPLFWKVTVERFGIDMQAVQRQHGLGLMIGAPLAAVMGPDETMAKPVMDPKVLTVCETCACARRMPVAEMGLQG
jgi:hypothetical protein